MLKPFHAANQRRAGHVGNVIDEATERTFTKATGFEGKYLACQAWDCEVGAFGRGKAAGGAFLSRC